MKFKITRHSGFAAPEDALELLWEQLGAIRDEVRFAKGRAEIRATWGEDVPVSMERHEREVLGRTAILEILSTVCEGEPGLKFDWFAVSARR
jgi:hypothetical protein